MQTYHIWKAQKVSFPIWSSQPLSTFLVWLNQHYLLCNLNISQISSCPNVISFFFWRKTFNWELKIIDAHHPVITDHMVQTSISTNLWCPSFNKIDGFFAWKNRLVLWIALVHVFIKSHSLDQALYLTKWTSYLFTREIFGFIHQRKKKKKTFGFASKVWHEWMPPISHLKGINFQEWHLLFWI